MASFAKLRTLLNEVSKQKVALVGLLGAASALTWNHYYYSRHLNAESKAPFPVIQSKHSLVAKHVTEEKWYKHADHVTVTSQFTLAKAIACAVEFDDQHCGIYAGDWDSYRDFADIFDPIIEEYHGIAADATHTSDMDFTKINGSVDPTAPVKSTRIRVGRNLDGFGLSPGILRDDRLEFEKLMKKAFENLTGDLAGTYYPLTGNKYFGVSLGVLRRLYKNY